MTDIFTDIVVETNDEGVTFDTLVGDDKPYKTPDDLAKAKRHADLHIKRLEAEAAEIRQELNKQLTMEELLTQIRTIQTPTPQSNLQVPPTNTETQTPDINELVRKALESQTSEARKKANEAQVTSKLAERFGNEAQSYLNKKASELGVTVAYLRSQAQENPAVFYRLVDLDRPTQQLPTAVAPRSGQNIQPSQGERDSKFWAKVKATDPKKYFSPEGYKERYRDMERALKAGKQWE